MVALCIGLPAVEDEVRELEVDTGRRQIWWESGAESREVRSLGSRRTQIATFTHWSHRSQPLAALFLGPP
jgi:hypothetical protein